MEDSRFSRYEEDFFNSTRIVERGLRQLDKVGTNAESITHIIIDIESELSETQGYIKAMETCCTDSNNKTNSNAISNINKKRQEKVKDYKEEYDELMKTFNKAKLKAQKNTLTATPASKSNNTNINNSSNNPSTLSSSSTVSSSTTNTRLINNNQKLDESTQMLEESRNILFQTEQIGNTVMTDLESQKESLLSSQNKIKETTQVTQDAKSILRGMGNRGVRLKICLYVTISILAAVIGLIVYYGIMANVF